MRKLLAVAAVCVAALIPAAMLAAPAFAAPRVPHVLVNGHYQVQNAQTGLFVHAHAVNSPMQDLASGIQTWLIKDPISWNSNHDGTVTTVKYALLNSSGQDTGWCADWHSNSGLVYLDPCDSGFADGSQQWYVPAVNALNDYIINADASAHTPNPPHDYRFLNDRPETGDYLYADPPGNGFYSQWIDNCQNC